MPHSDEPRRLRIIVEGPPASGKTTLVALLGNMLRREFGSVPLTVDTMGLGPREVKATPNEAAEHLSRDVSLAKWGAREPVEVAIIERTTEPAPSLSARVAEVAAHEGRTLQGPARERRQLMQRIISHPDAIADLLLSLLARVEALEWDLQDHPTGEVQVQATVEDRLHTLLRVDPVTSTRR